MGNYKKRNIDKQAEPAEDLRTKRIVGVASIVVFIALMLTLFFTVGKQLIEFVSEPEQFRNWVNESGVWGRIAFVGMMALQIIVAIIPGEPLEIGAGYAFGVWEGTGLCLLGALAGSALVFILVRRLGSKVVYAFFSRDKIEKISFLQDSKKLNLLAFILFLIPGTPKDVMTYFIGITPMKLSTWLLITGTARIPSVVTSTFGGDALGLGNYSLAIWVFAITIAISLIGILVYKKISKKHT
ncbi:MAG: TVP38/TMEM64 family protein [Candidatus Gastranaerophilaceae bacterium]|jgi:uncharacterized membrane protein YdjX (TVP38/TMEM64 family)|nr:TVP38/TMEM64 family protein [Christensenellales bacterium]